MTFNDYITLCKPRVIALMVLTAVVAMFLAAPPDVIPWSALLLGSLGITFAAGAGGTINHLIDRKIDAIMARTKNRPLPSGRVKLQYAIVFAAALTIVGMSILFFFVNPVTAILSLSTLIGYAGIYTLFLKRATPQNIVIGGLAGAMPPLLGWTAVTGHIDANGLLLVLIIFTWTPPHFWALAVARHEEYRRAQIPMLPVTHGIPFTRLSILLYTLLMIAATYLPIATNMCGLIYCVGVSVLNLIFLGYALKLFIYKSHKTAMHTFHYSIVYLGLLFSVLLLDHYTYIAL